MVRNAGYQRLDPTFFPDYGRQIVEAEASLRSPGSAFERVSGLGRLGMLLLASTHTMQQGLQCLEEAYTRSIELRNTRLIAANRIRRATALQYCGMHHQALAEFDAAVRYIADLRVRRLKDFALQHKGKCLVEMDQADSAADCFRAALILRRRRKDAELVHSTMLAIEAVAAMGIETGSNRTINSADPAVPRPQLHQGQSR